MTTVYNIKKILNMFGDYNKLITNVLDSISRWFTDLSCKTSEVLDVYDNHRSGAKRLQKAVYILIGAFFMLISSIYGFVYGTICLFTPFLSSQVGDKKSIRQKELLYIFSLCIVVFISLFMINKIDYAKNMNLYYFNNRNDINYICKSELPAINTSYANEEEENAFLYNLRNVLECTKTSKSVSDIRELAKDNLPGELNFATVNDYLITLLSLKQYDVLDNCTSIYTEKRNEIRLFHQYLSTVCKKSFEYEKFQTSETYLNLIMKFANNSSISDYPHYNNSFYLMKMFNENIIDRYFSSHHNNELLSTIVDNVSNINLVFDESEFNTPVSHHEGDIFKYLEYVRTFNNGHISKIYPTDEFLQLYKTTESNIIKQYSLNMALRSQHEDTYYQIYNDYDDKDIRKSIKKLKSIQNDCNNKITYRYLSNTIDIYTINY